MPRRLPAIERLTPPADAADLRELAALLVDTVASGSTVSFLAPLTPERAEDWWRKTISEAHAGAIFIVARDEEGIAGTVQLHPAWAPNQPHRADVAKLMVHRRARRTGLGTRLMEEIEDAARSAGIIPAYAFDSDGTPHDTVIFYKHLQPRG